MDAIPLGREKLHKYNAGGETALDTYNGKAWGAFGMQAKNELAAPTLC